MSLDCLTGQLPKSPYIEKFTSEKCFLPCDDVVGGFLGAASSPVAYTKFFVSMSVNESRGLAMSQISASRLQKQYPRSSAWILFIAKDYLNGAKSR